MAGRIPQTFINSLLERADIVALIGERVALKRKGASFWGCCPFHDEKTPSFHVLPDRQFYKCFGCGESGTALSFLMAYERLEFVEAIEQLAGRCGLEVPRDGEIDSAAEREREQLLGAVAQAAAWFEQLLASERGAIARDYLQRRGISVQTIARFGIGYAPGGYRSLVDALPNVAPALLERAGLLARNERGIYDRFRDRVMFPIKNGRGRVIGFGGRVLGDGEPKYLNSPESPIFHKGQEIYGLQDARRHAGRDGKLVLVEGYMDVVGLAQHGVDNAVAALGTAVSSAQLERLLGLAPELVCCFDADRAGDAAARRALENALPVLRDQHRLSFLRLPEGQDPDSLVRGAGVAAWQQVLAQRVPFADFFVARLGDGLRLETIDDRTEFVRRAEPWLVRLAAGVRQKLLRDRVRELAGLAVAAPRAATPPSREEADAGRWELPPQPANAPRRRSPINESSLAFRTLALLLQAPELAREAELAAVLAAEAARDDVAADDRAVRANAGDGISVAGQAVPGNEQLLIEVVRVLVDALAAGNTASAGAELSAEQQGRERSGLLLGYFHGHPGAAEIERARVLSIDLPRSEWPAALRGALTDFARGRGRRRAALVIDSDDALRAQFEARRRREEEREAAP